jgi:3-deoxy-7-phosphoheptulonate synthase
MSKHSSLLTASTATAVVLHAGASPEQRAALARLLAAASEGVIPRPLPLGAEVAFRIPAAALSDSLAARLAAHPAVARLVPIATPYILASRAVHPAPTTVRVGSVIIGGGAPIVIAGPCAVESEAQIFEAAHAAREAGAHLLRGGAFKPRTSPYSFQGLGIAGIELLARAGAAAGLPVVTEVMEPSLVEPVAAFADVLQVGSRNMQNFPLLRAVGRSGKPVLLKRGFAATIDEWLLAAEHILLEGNQQVILCERGIRGFDPHTRNVLDLAAVPLLHQLTHLPVLVDPSHATGRADLVVPMAIAAVAAGADGLLIEMHPHPDQALSDAEQAISPAALRALVARAPAVHAALAAPDAFADPAPAPQPLHDVPPDRREELAGTTAGS